MDFFTSENIIVSVIGAVVSVASYFFGYKKQNSEAEHEQEEAHRSAYEALTYAMSSLRSEFEARIKVLQEENQRLREVVQRLESERPSVDSLIEENQRLKSKIQHLEEQLYTQQKD